MTSPQWSVDKIKSLIESAEEIRRGLEVLCEGRDILAAAIAIQHVAENLEAHHPKVFDVAEAFLKQMRKVAVKT